MRHGCSVARLRPRPTSWTFLMVYAGLGDMHTCMPTRGHGGGPLRPTSPTGPTGPHTFPGKMFPFKPWFSYSYLKPMIPDVGTMRRLHTCANMVSAKQLCTLPRHLHFRRKRTWHTALVLHNSALGVRSLYSPTSQRVHIARDGACPSPSVRLRPSPLLTGGSRSWPFPVLTGPRAASVVLLP